MLAMVLGSPSMAQSRHQALSDLYQSYNQRFDAQGKYRANPRLAEQFTSVQEAFAKRMKEEGALQEILFVENNFAKDLWVRLYVFQDESGRLLTVYWEQGQYQDAEVRSFLRFRTLKELEQGLRYVPVLSTYAVTFKGISLSDIYGGSVQIEYAHNLRQNKMEKVDLVLVKGPEGKWGLQNTSGQPIHQAWLDIWMQFLPPNGGVRGIKLNWSMKGSDVQFVQMAELLLYDMDIKGLLF